MTFPWEKPAPLPMPWDAPAVPVRSTDDTVRALQRDVAYMVTHTAIMVHATGPQAAALGMLINTRRGQLVPTGEVKCSGGHTLRFQDLGMPQPGAPEATVQWLVAEMVDVTHRLGLEIEP